MSSLRLVQIFAFLLMSHFFVLFQIGPDPGWERDAGIVWGGDETVEVEVVEVKDCPDCDDWQASISCIFAKKHEETKCFKQNGELLGDRCQDSAPCTENNGWQCGTASVRAYATGATRAVVENKDSMRVRPCFKTKDEKIIFCDCEIEIVAGGATQKTTNSLPCFSVTNCYTQVGGCVLDPNSNLMKCSNSGVALEGTADEEFPNTTFPCPTQKQQDDALKACKDENKGD